MMTEQRLQEIDEGNVPEQRAIDECVAEIRRLRAEVAQAQQEREWQPIETAPRDGREVILAVAMRAGIPHGVLVGHFMPGGHCIDDHPAIDGGWYFWNGCMFDKAANPTHWMEMPCHPLASDWQRARQKAIAQPPALPPLPDKWQRQEYDSESVTFLNGPDFYFDAFASGVVMHIDDCFAERINVADLLIVLRHAEAAHQRRQQAGE